MASPAPRSACEGIYGPVTSRSRTLSADKFSRMFPSSKKNQSASFPSRPQWTPSNEVSAMSSATTSPEGLFSLMEANTSWPSRHPPHPDIPASGQTHTHTQSERDTLHSVQNSNSIMSKCKVAVGLPVTVWEHRGASSKQVRTFVQNKVHFILKRAIPGLSQARETRTIWERRPEQIFSLWNS